MPHRLACAAAVVATVRRKRRTESPTSFSAPASSSAVTHLKWPCTAARCRGAQPFCRRRMRGLRHGVCGVTMAVALKGRAQARAKR